METLTYYRGYRLPAELEKRIRTTWGDRDIVSLPVDHNYGTGQHDLVEVLATIQCDPKLNAREKAIEARIAHKKGKLTPSKSSHYEFVEEKLICDLATDAIDLYNSERDSDHLKSYDFWQNCRHDLMLTYGIKTKISFLHELEEDERWVATVPKNVEPIKDLKFTCSTNYASAFREYRITKKELERIGISTFMWYGTVKDIPAMIRAEGGKYLGKLYYSTLFKEHNLQVNVYDSVNSHNAFFAVMRKLMEIYSK
jgi:hypothetical protein